MKCNMWHGNGGYPTYVLSNPPDLTLVDCELLPLGRGDGAELNPGVVLNGLAVRSRLLFPKGTDVRDFRSQIYFSIVEFDGLSGHYRVMGVYDVGYGWPDEFRVAVVCPANNAAGVTSWVPPYPAGS